MKDLERRIVELERGWARQRRLTTALLAALSLVLAAGLARDETFDLVRAKRIEIVDEAGERCAELTRDASGTGALRLYGASEGPEKPYASLAAVRGGGQLELGSVGGTTTASLGTTGFGDSWGGFLRLISDDYPVVSLWTSNGTANFQMIDSDQEGGFLCGTRSVSSGRAGWLEVRNGKGESALYLLAGEEGEGVVELYDSDEGEPRTLRASER